MLKKCFSGKLDVTNNPLFFLLQATTHRNFIFISQFLQELNPKVHLSKSVRGFPIFGSVSFLLKFIFFVPQKVRTLSL